MYLIIIAKWIKLCFIQYFIFDDLLFICFKKKFEQSNLPKYSSPFL